VESHHDAMVVDVTCDATDQEQAQRITAALGEPAGFTVRKVSDRTFLIHLGGKIEVQLNRSYIVPSVFDPTVAPAVAAAIRNLSGGAEAVTTVGAQ